VIDRSRVPTLRISAGREARPGGPYGLEASTRDQKRIHLPYRVEVVAGKEAAPSRESRGPVAEAVVSGDGSERNPLQTLDVVQGGTTTLRPDGEFVSFRVVRAACSIASIASIAGEPQVETPITAELVSSHAFDRRTLEPTIGPSNLVIAASEAADPGRYARLQGADAEGDWNLLPICIRVTEAPAEPRRADTTPPGPTPEPAPEPITAGSCPEDYFSAGEIAAAQPTRFRFPIPNVGSSGHSSGPHLHFAVRKQNSSGNWAWVDPYDPQNGASLWTQQYGGIAGSLPGPQCQ
jgi:hypothetical protein